MYIIDLKSAVIKKKLGAKSVAFRWHNKNNYGGNFGINIIDVNGRDYEISGHYSTSGLLYALRFGRIYQAGSPMLVNTLDEMFEFIATYLKNQG